MEIDLSHNYTTRKWIKSVYENDIFRSKRFIIWLGVIVFSALWLMGLKILGSPKPIYIRDTLSSPIGVLSWDQDGLMLVSGQRIQLPEYSKLPIESVALSDAVKYGVEITNEGRIFGLVTIDYLHDFNQIKLHLERIDLTLLLTFLREGERVAAPEFEFYTDKKGGRYSSRGWVYDEAGRFLRYLKHADNFN